MTSQQNEGKWTSVRITADLVPPLERLVENVKDEFGMRLFRSKSDAVTKALKEFFKKHSFTLKGA